MMLRLLFERIKCMRDPIKYSRKKGVTIGENCVIGVGAIVTKNIPSNSVAVGVPARVIETIEEYKEKNIDRFEHTKMVNYEQKKSIC